MKLFQINWVVCDNILNSYLEFNLIQWGKLIGCDGLWCYLIKYDVITDLCINSAFQLPSTWSKFSPCLAWCVIDDVTLIPHQTEIYLSQCLCRLKVLSIILLISHNKRPRKELFGCTFEEWLVKNTLIIMQSLTRERHLINVK